VLFPGLFCLCGEFLGEAKGIHGMFQRLFAEFVCREVVAVIVRNDGGLMSVNGKVVQL
jgi:hypothetical protein